MLAHYETFEKYSKIQKEKLKKKNTSPTSERQPHYSILLYFLPVILLNIFLYISDHIIYANLHPARLCKQLVFT